MLTIKFARKGKKGMPMYRLIISEKGRDTYGDALEILGTYNPHNKKLDAKLDRIKHWLSVGAQMTGVVNNLLIEHKVIEGKKLRVSRLSKKSRTAAAKLVEADKKKALDDKKNEAANALKAKEEAEAAKVAAAEAAKAEAEAPKEETTEAQA